MGQISLEQQIKDLVNNATSSGKVVDRINRRIKAINDELLEDIKESAYMEEHAQGHVDADGILSNTRGDFEDDLFRAGLEILAYNGNVNELCMYEVESLVSNVNDVGRLIRIAKRKVAELENLLKESK
jgi:hypothetical protein